MGAKPEIKYKSPESFAGLYKTQREIIARSAEYLKPGGTMIYSTCSINKTENEETVEAFLETNKGFRLAEMSTSLPCDCNGEGFFTAKLIRENR